MAENLTRPTAESPIEYLAALTPPRQRDEALDLLALMTEETGVEPRMWGPSMIGFGQYHYRYASGHEGDTFVVGFAPRSGRFSMYNLIYLPEAQALLERLGSFTTGKGCLYVKRLDDIDRSVLRRLIRVAWVDGGKIARAV